MPFTINVDCFMQIGSSFAESATKVLKDSYKKDDDVRKGFNNMFKNVSRLNYHKYLAFR